MKAFKETTNWNFANHIYFLHDSRLVAYVKEGTDTMHVFSKPLNFSRKGRTFREVKYRVV